MNLMRSIGLDVTVWRVLEAIVIACSLSLSLIASALLQNNCKRLRVVKVLSEGSHINCCIGGRGE